MPTVASSQPYTQFGDVIFPGETHTVDGDGRHHIHEYPHTPGGSPEKLGRGLYTITIRGNFQATFPVYPNLYPNGMNTLRSYFEQQLTKTLTHPSAGSFPAFITKWHQVKSARMLSGEIVDITFLEDQSAQFQLANTLTAASTAIGPSAAQLAQELASIQQQLALSDNDLSIFQAIQNIATTIGSIQDTVSLYGNSWSDQLQSLAGLCSQADSSSSMQDARAWPVVDAVLNVWQATMLTLQNLQSKSVPLDTYIVKKTQSIVDCALDIYGDASRASDLIALNPGIADSLSIPAATPLFFYAN